MRFRETKLWGQATDRENSMSERTSPVDESGESAMEMLAKVQDQYQTYLNLSRLCDLTTDKAATAQPSRSTASLRLPSGALIEL